MRLRAVGVPVKHGSAQRPRKIVGKIPRQRVLGAVDNAGLQRRVEFRVGDRCRPPRQALTVSIRICDLGTRTFLPFNLRKAWRPGCPGRKSGTAPLPCMRRQPCPSSDSPYTSSLISLPIRPFGLSRCSDRGTDKAAKRCSTSWRQNRPN